MNYENLFTPGYIGGLRIKNRVVMTAMGNGLAAENGEASDEIIACYKARAAGGCGLLITEFCAVDGENGIAETHQLQIHAPRFIKRLALLTDTLHRYDCKVFFQLFHPGREGKPQFNGGRQVISASGIVNPATGRVSHEMTREEIHGYWHLFLGYGLFPTMYIICYPRFSVLISDAGYSLSAATIGVSIYSICNVIGRLGMGALIDKLGYRKVYTICGICSVASSLCLMFAHSLAMFYIAYVLLAVGFGATNCCHPVAVQETYGSKYAGGIFGICMLGYMIICTFISPKISSALVKATGSYTASMIYAIIACIIAVAVYTTIPMPKRRTLAEVAAEEKAAQEKAAQA